MFTFLSTFQYYDSSDSTSTFIGLICGLAICIGLGAAGASIMKNKGRSQALGWVLGIFLGLIGIIICAVISPNPDYMAQRQAMPQMMRADEMKCPHCQETIKIGATVCRFCGKDPRFPPNT